MAYNSKYTGQQVEDLLDKVEGITVPTKTSELTNDSGFITDSALEGYATTADLAAKQDVLTAGDGIVIEDNVISATGGGGGADSALWNVYLFESADSGDSVVTIDGVDVTIAAGTTVQGSFTDDISAIVTHNLKRVIVRGDVSFSFAAGTGSSYRNTTLEEVDMTFSAGFVRSFDYMFCQQQVLRSLRVRGGQPTGAYYMCAYVAYGNPAVAPCAVDIKGMDFSQMTSSNGASYMFTCSFIDSVNLSGCEFSNSVERIFASSWTGSVNLSGCTFGGSARRLFGSGTFGSIDLSGCTFSDITTYMFYSATVGSVDMSGCTFGGSMNYFFNGATVGSVDMSGCTFKDSSCTQMFYSATINSLSLCGCDLSGLSVSSSNRIWTSATIGALDLNGVTLPTDGASNAYFINGMNDATKIGAIAGDFGEIAGGDPVDLSSLELRRGSMIAILNALNADGGEVYFSRDCWQLLMQYEIDGFYEKGWSINYK